MPRGMGRISLSLLLGILIFTGAGCVHDRTITPSADKKTGDLADLIGTHNVVCYHWFDSHCDTTHGTLTVIQLSDSTIATNNMPTIPLTYISTDSAASTVLYYMKYGPPTLRFCWTNDSIHYSLNNSGIHSDDLECYSTP